MQKENYKAVRIKTETYKKIKLLAVELDIPITKLTERMFEMFTEKQKYSAHADALSIPGLNAGDFHALR